MAEIRKHNGRTAIFVDGKPLTSPMAFIRTRVRDEENRPEIKFDAEYFKSLRESGIQVYMLSCNTLWLQPDALEVFDKEARMLLEAVPDAYIVARFGLHPPVSWVEENPDECVLFSDGKPRAFHLITESYEADYPRFYSLCSQKWREDAGRALVEAWGKVLELPYADRIIGCFPTAGQTSEWYYVPRVVDHQACAGYCKAFRREFSSYLRDLYGTDEALQKAWKMPDVTIDNPPLPKYEEHYFGGEVDGDAAVPREKMLSWAPVPPSYNNGTHIGSFTDMDKVPWMYHFLRAWHLGVARSQIHFARLIKQMTPDRITIFCYGAQGACDHNRGCTNGGTRLILESDCVDILENPAVYENRNPGGFVAQRVVQDSFSLHGKVYLCQDDTRTLAENRYFRNRYQVYDMTDTLNVIKREFGRSLCDDMHQWWFDQLIGGGRFRYPEVYELLAEQQRIADEAYSLDRTKKSEIALIFSEESFQAVSFETSRSLVEMLRNYELARIGAPVDQYYHNDMANPEMPSYKMYIFVNTLVLTAKDREVIKAKLKKDGAVAVWLYAPGFADPAAEQKMSLSHMEELTGMKMAMDEQCYDANFRWDGEPHPISASLDKRMPFGNLTENRRVNNGTTPTTYRDTYLYPVFYSADESATHIAHFASSGYPAVSVKECDGYTSVFYGSKTINEDVIREMARFAGVHVFCDSNDVTYTGANYITFHASSSGKKILRFSKPTTVYEVYEKKTYAPNATEVEFEAYFGETKMFRYT